jgi:hypothetical protein
VIEEWAIARETEREIDREREMAGGRKRDMKR